MWDLSLSESLAELSRKCENSEAMRDTVLELTANEVDTLEADLIQLEARLFTAHMRAAMINGQRCFFGLVHYTPRDCIVDALAQAGFEVDTRAMAFRTTDVCVYLRDAAPASSIHADYVVAYRRDCT